MMRRAPLLSALALPLIMLGVGSAVAQDAGTGVDVRIREVSFATGNETRLIVSVSGAGSSGALSTDDFSVTEQGAPVEGLQVEPLFGEGQQAQQVSVSLLMDRSQSTRGKLAGARAAAKRFITGLPPSVRANVFAFSWEVRALSGLTVLDAPGSGARSSLAGTIDGLVSATRSGTQLYDAVLAATDALKAQSGQRNIVIFSDGNDVGSDASLADAVKAIDAAGATTTAVLLSTARIDEAALQQMADAAEGGTFVRVQNSTALSEAFGRVAESISNQYVLTYAGTSQDDDLNIEVSVTAAGTTVSDAIAALNERSAVDEPAPARPSGPLVPALASKAGLYLGIFAVFASLLLFIGMIFYAPAGQRAERILARGLRMYTRGQKDKEKKAGSGDAGVLSGTSVGRAAVGLMERVPRPKQYDEKMQAALDQAGWPLRSTEFILIQIGSIFVGILLGFVLFQSPVVGIIMTVVGALAPRLALTNTISRRESSFLEQLPDTLQLLAGSLQAGYGFLQAIDTVAKESSPPTSVEFSRVLAEARLGMPLEDALEAMAERLGSDDFRWVVLAINIQRQVGGNLAQLLTTISDTLREREQVRRQIKVLSAEGRLSAVVLTVLPFALVGYLSVVNPSYLTELTSVTSGRIAILVALVLMGLGVVWMRKIIKIDV